MARLGEWKNDVAHHSLFLFVLLVLFRNVLADPLDTRAELMLRAPHEPERLIVAFRANTPDIAKVSAHQRAGIEKSERARFARHRDVNLVEVDHGRIRAALSAYLRDPNVLLSPGRLNSARAGRVKTGHC